MAYRAFKLLSESERRRIADAVSTAFAGWSEAWMAQRAVANDASCDPASEHDSLALDSDWLTFESPAGTVHFVHGERVCEEISNAISGGASDTPASRRASRSDDSIASNLVDAALQDLVARLTGAECVRTRAAPPRTLWHQGSGAACVTLPLGRNNDVLTVFDTKLVSRWIGPAVRSPRRSGALSNLQQCFGDEKVGVDVWLGSADIELGTLKTLAINDVLLLESRIDQPLRVTVAGHDVAPRAVLGHAGPNKAVRLTTYAPE